MLAIFVELPPSANGRHADGVEGSAEGGGEEAVEDPSEVQRQRHGRGVQVRDERGGRGALHVPPVPDDAGTFRSMHEYGAQLNEF